MGGEWRGGEGRGGEEVGELLVCLLACHNAVPKVAGSPRTFLN